MVNIINGKSLSEKILNSLAEKIDKSRISPTLAVILVGDNPASHIYVKNKEKAAKSIGINPMIYTMPEDVAEKNVISLIEELNKDNSVNGILVQLPLPKHLDQNSILSKILPYKDVDGLHEINMGRLFLGLEPYHYPCTPLGIVELLKSINVSFTGLNAVVVGRSNIVGKPISAMLTRLDMTVTVCHSKTVDLSFYTKNADLVVVAIGKPNFLKADMVKPGAVIIDVGINRIDSGLVGDVDFHQVKEVAGYITPVPGGVGPMTIAMLMSNCLNAANFMKNLL